MAQDDDTHSDESNSTISGSRRTVLKMAGIGAGLATLGGASIVGAGQQDEDEDDEDQNGDDSHFVEDLIDPTFGYPLAADESDDVDLENVVELATEEGAGAHENFPINPETGEVIPFEFSFDPAGILVEPDDIVHFQIAAGEHTVTAFHEKFTTAHHETPTRVPEGVPGFTSPPIMEDESWLYQFSTKGVYDIHCLPHRPAGMVMRVVVFDPDEDDVSDDTFAAPTAGELTPNTQAVFAAEELTPQNIVDAGTVGWDELTLEIQQPGTETPTGTETPSETETPTGNESSAIHR